MTLKNEMEEHLTAEGQLESVVISAKQGWKVICLKQNVAPLSCLSSSELWAHFVPERGEAHGAEAVPCAQAPQAKHSSHLVQGPTALPLELTEVLRCRVRRSWVWCKTDRTAAGTDL